MRVESSMWSPIRFGEVYGVNPTARDDWFDPLLTEDTPLFVDPFLIFLEETSRWTNGHAQLMEFFNMVMGLLAESGFRVGVPAYRKAKNLLLFHEPPEFCLGLSEGSIFGAGSAKGLQSGMLAGAKQAIGLGLSSLKHFEELAFFGEQIGPDRISDITCDILKADFIEYTQEVCSRHNIPVQQVNVGTAGWDAARKIWRPGLVDLPVNPVASEIVRHPVGVLLTPKRFLRQLPSIDPVEFWDYAMSVEGDVIRSDLNYELGQRVDRALIGKLARRHHRLLTSYIERLEADPKSAYDVDEDPRLVVHAVDFEKQYVSRLATVAEPSSEDEFVRFIERLIDNFRWCVEEGGASELLWTRTGPRPEASVQALFKTSAVLACKEHNVDMSPEANAGRGAVDFKMSVGWSRKVLIEMKLAGSGSLQRNVERQVPTYAKAEGAKFGYMVVVQFRDRECDPEFVQKVKDLAKRIGEAEGFDYKAVFVDARPKLTASKL